EPEPDDQQRDEKDGPRVNERTGLARHDFEQGWRRNRLEILSAGMKPDGRYREGVSARLDEAGGGADKRPDLGKPRIDLGIVRSLSKGQGQFTTVDQNRDRQPLDSVAVADRRDRLRRDLEIRQLLPAFALVAR